MSYTQAPPEPVSTGNGPSGPRAGFWRRFAAAFIDGLLIGIVASVVLAVIGGSIAVRELIQIWLRGAVSGGVVPALPTSRARPARRSASGPWASA